MAEVVSLGIVVADIVAKPVDKWPERGRLMIVDTMELHNGGHATNVSISLSRLGIEAATMGKVGEDVLGNFLIDVLKRNGVDTSHIICDPNVPTSTTMALVDSAGERSFIHLPGANASIKEEEIDMDFISKAKILYLAGFFAMPGFDGEPVARVLKGAKERGVTTALDTVWDFSGSWLKLLEPCLPYVDMILPSIEEAKMLTDKEEPGDIAKVVMDYGVKIVCLKMGERGCYIKTADEELVLPAYKVKVVDTTGAGDAHTAGFLTGIVKGWDLVRAGRFANAVGALCVTAIGTTGGVRSLEETLQFMEEGEVLNV